MKTKKTTQIAAFFGLIFLLIPNFTFDCTSFALKHKGYLIFGTNYDNSFAPGMIYVNKRNVQKSGFEPGTSGKTAKWVSKYGSVTFANVGYQLAWAGMNEAGLVMSTMALQETKSPTADERPPLISPMWMQYMLDTCATVEEVIASDNSVRIFETVDHYLVCDRKGICAAVEFLDGKMVYHTEESLPVRALANKLYSTCADHWKRKAPSPSHPYDSINRIARVADKLSSYKAKDDKNAIDYAFKILKDVRNPNNVAATRWSIVFDTNNFRIYYRSYANQNIRWIDFKRFDFDCRTPVEMLDVHNDLSGDVTDSFIDYSHDSTLDLLLKSVKNFRPDIPLEQIKFLLQIIENFPCQSK
jgi:choloylglycine hydrolase